jgi:RNA polymerase sigma-70 factor (ECF subfamily)
MLKVDDRANNLAIEAQISDNSPRVINRVFNQPVHPMKEEKEKELQKTGADSAAEFSSLIRRSQEGDSLAIEAIYEQYKRPLFTLAYRYTYNSATTEDLLQEIFIKVFTHLKDIEKVETFSGWVYRIAINTCYSYLREKKDELQKTIPMSDVKAEVEEPREQSRDLDLKKPLDEAIETLPKKLKTVFLLHDVQGFKHHEISRMLDCSIGTSKSQLFKARLRLRNYLRDKQIL